MAYVESAAETSSPGLRSVVRSNARNHFVLVGFRLFVFLLDKLAEL
jgi:hypothetical protein